MWLFMRTGKTLPLTALSWGYNKDFFVLILRKAEEVEQGPGRAAKTAEDKKLFQEGLEILGLLRMEGMVEVCKIMTITERANWGKLLP